MHGSALKGRAEEILELTQLSQLRAALTGELPGGIRQRLALGCAILHRPRVLFLDEPTAGVDPLVRRDFWRLIRRLSAAGTTIFVTTHYLDEAEYCQRIGLMADGHLVALDTPAELKRVWVPGKLWSARGRGLLQAAAALQKAPEVVRVEPFGAGLHIRTEGTHWDAERVGTAISGAGGREVHVEAIDASLEDVFLAVSASREGPR
jgi:ABC-2 type transport system ATP-binding protein